MSVNTTRELDLRAVRRAFNDAAPAYDAHATLQREVADRLVARLDLVSITPAAAVDLGAGTGYCASLLTKRYPRARLLLVDVAPAMLVIARQRTRRWWSRRSFLCADAVALPMPPASVDLIVSSLTLQWCTDLMAVFDECARILRPGGLLLFSTLGPDTLHELRAAWAAVDETPHVNRFLDMHIVGDALIHAGFSSPVMEREDLAVTYPEIGLLLRDLKGIGARNSQTQRSRSLYGRRGLATLAGAYEKFRRDGVLPATYEVIYGHAWAPSQQTRPQDGSTIATYPLSQLKRR